MSDLGAAGPTTIASGRYQVRGLLGQGGMAAVYRVYDTRLRVECAIKVLAPEYSAKGDLRRRFESEAATMARLRHPAASKPAPRPAAAPVVDAPAAAVALVATPPPPAPAVAPANASVSISGDADSVTLVGTAGRFPPGDVPPGAYTIEAAFAGGPAAPAGKITVTPGQSVTVKCVSDFARCK